MYWKIELRACSWVANVRRRSRSFSSEAKNDSLAALSCGLPLRLLDCVIPVRAARGTERNRRVLTAAVCVLDDPLAGPALRDGHLERTSDQRRVGDRPHRPAHDPAGEAVQHAGEVQHALAGR